MRKDKVNLKPFLDNNGLKTKPDEGIYRVETYMIDLCEQWIKAYCHPRKTINPKAFSYHLKHVVERWANEYVTNAAFIQAATNLGYTYINASPTGYKLSPNANFNMSLPRKRTSEWKDSRLGE